MLNYLSKSIVIFFLFIAVPSMGNSIGKMRHTAFKGELISHVQVKKNPSNSHLTSVRFALHYDARVSVFFQKRGSSALIQFKKTTELKKGVKTLQIDRIQYPPSKYQLVIKAGKTSKVVDYSL